MLNNFKFISSIRKCSVFRIDVDMLIFNNVNILPTNTFNNIIVNHPSYNYSNIIKQAVLKVLNV